MKDIIILNGPPGCGKDAIAKRLVELMPTFAHHEVKHRLVELAVCMSGLTYDGWQYLQQREFKEKPTPVLGGLSPRGFLIHISENVMKPLYGNRYFGDAAAARVAASSAKTIVFSDGGFAEEVAALSQVGYVHLIHIHREGYTFSGDSRSYLDANAPYLSTYLKVEQTEGELDDAVHDIALHMIEWCSK